MSRGLPALRPWPWPPSLSYAFHLPRLFARALPVDPPPPHPSHTDRGCIRRGGGRCAQGGHTERGEVQPERRTARGCTASAVSSHARKGRPHANGGVYARGWCPPAFSQRWEDVRAGQGATRARAARETEGAGTLSAPSRPVNRLRKINVK
ncbi:hypothetical protein BJY52DRAFT_1341695 [Lactarius psammicola]|nr:hypothetical protein BJY52DRAFT_1341695 [Lactarius psammicola]